MLMLITGGSIWFIGMRIVRHILLAEISAITEVGKTRLTYTLHWVVIVWRMIVIIL